MHLTCLGKYMHLSTSDTLGNNASLIPKADKCQEVWTKQSQIMTIIKLISII